MGRDGHGPKEPHFRKKPSAGWNFKPQLYRHNKYLAIFGTCFAAPPPNWAALRNDTDRCFVHLSDHPER